MYRKYCLSVICLSLAFLSGPISASEEEEKDKGDKDKEKRAITIQLENDAFSQLVGLRDSDSEALGFDGDKDYTQGFRIGLTFEEDNQLPVFEWIDSVPVFSLADEVRGGDKAETKIKYTHQFFVGQNIYTPTDISQTTVQTNDRPYAGWLYIGTSHSRETNNYFETLEFDVGILGPASGAEFIQKEWHKIVDTRPTLGWDTQLKNEPGFSFTYMRARQFNIFPGEKTHGFGLDFTPHATAALGTIYTHASIGGTLRIGTGRQREIVTPNRVQPSMPGTDYYRDGPWSLYAFIAVEGRAVGRNAFIDGNFFSKSHSLNKDTLVGDLAIGLVFFTKEYRFAYTHTFRSDEYKDQSGGHYFGSFSITKTF